MARAPANDQVRIWTPILAGGPAPQIDIVPCRFVPLDQIVDITPPFDQYIGYIVYDPPNQVTAAFVQSLGSGFGTIDWWVSNPLELLSQPGVLFYPSQVDEITTATDHYFRAWILHVAVVD